MKKFLMILLVVALCVSMAACKKNNAPAVTEDGNEGAPIATSEAVFEENGQGGGSVQETTDVAESENEFVPSITYKGSPALIAAVDAEGNSIADCLRIVPVSEAEELTKDKRELLEQVYEELSAGTMVLPYEKVEGIDADKMVIRELVEVYFTCHDEHKSGYELTCDLGVEDDVVLVAMAYVEGEEGFEWVPAIEIIHNGDGTVTFKFDQLCPVAIAIEG